MKVFETQFLAGAHVLVQRPSQGGKKSHCNDGADNIHDCVLAVVARRVQGDVRYSSGVGELVGLTARSTLMTPDTFLRAALYLTPLV